MTSLYDDDGEIIIVPLAVPRIIRLTYRRGRMQTIPGVEAPPVVLPPNPEDRPAVTVPPLRRQP